MSVKPIKKNGKVVKRGGLTRFEILYRLKGDRTRHRKRVWAESLVHAQVMEFELKGNASTSGITWTAGHDLWSRENDNLSSSYLEGMRYNLEFLTRIIGNIPIQETTLKQFSGFLAERAKVSGRTANVARKLITVATWLRGRGHLESIPFEYAQTLDERPAVPRGSLTLEEIPKYINSCTPELQPMLKFLLLTGLRITACCTLTEGDVSGDSMKVTEKGIRGRKTIRVIPVDRDIKELVRSAVGLKNKMTSKSSTVFVNAKGTAWNRHSMNHCWTRCLKRAGLPHRKLHELRHTFGTIAGEEKLSIKQIQAGMGHLSARTTERYVHDTQSMVDETHAAVRAKIKKVW